jgi:hypothetical protein
VNIAHSEMVEKELDILIERRSRREPDPDEREELWKESVRRYHTAKHEELRAAWCEYHQAKASGLRATLEELINYHETQLQKLQNGIPKGAA